MANTYRLTVHLYQADQDRLKRLNDRYGLNASNAVRAGLAVLEERMSTEKERMMITDCELFDRFTGGQASTVEVAEMGLAGVERQVGEFRAEGWHDLPYSDAELAERIYFYAVEANQ